MSFKSAMQAYDLLDSAYTTGAEVVKMFQEAGADEASYERLTGRGFTDVVHIFLNGKSGKSSGSPAPTLNLSASLVAIGARPGSIGLVGDGDGALIVIAAGLKMLDMKKKGDQQDGDVIISFNVTGAAPHEPPVCHQPPEFNCPVNFWKMKSKCVDGTADAILNVNVTRSDRYCKRRGFAITPTVLQGWLLKISEDALNVMERVTGETAVMPLTMQELMPTRNGISFLNDIGALPYEIDIPCIGVAMCSPIPQEPICSGMTDLAEIEPAVRYCVEVAKDFGMGRFDFYDKAEFEKIIKLYGSMKHLQTFGKQSSVKGKAGFKELVAEYGAALVY